jgi:hypothetical protein
MESSPPLPKIVVVYREPHSHPKPLFDTLAKVAGEEFNPEDMTW